MNLKLSFEKKRIISFSLSMILAVLLVVIDQVTKILAETYIDKNDPIVIINGVFRLRLLMNPGAAFGSMQDSRWIFMTFSSIAIVAMMGYLFYASFVKPATKLYTLSVSAIMAGGIGNMIDRIFVGEVVDFFDFYLIKFAVFNFADCCVCVGAGFLVLALILDLVKEAKAEKEKKNASKG